MLGHWKYSDHVNAFGDDAIIVPMPDFGGGVYTCSGSTVVVMTQKAVDEGRGDNAWTVIDAIMSPEYIHMVCDVNGGVPARSSVMDTMDRWQKGGRLYLYREQLEGGISYLRPITPAHATVYNAVASVKGQTPSVQHQRENPLPIHLGKHSYLTTTSANHLSNHMRRL